jgi:hypothetical protein
MPTMRNDQPDGRPTNRKARRQGATQPRFGAGRVVPDPRQYAMRRR